MRPVGGPSISRFGVCIATALLVAATACTPTRLVVHAAKEAIRITEGNKTEAEAATRPQRAAVIPSTQGTYKVGDPYEIDGVWYYPKEDPDYLQTGIASWYGKPFHGQLTANGEIYDMNSLTAAHKTLPMPTYARVTNLENARVITVRINDRGPFVHGRIIDLSRRAAQLLGFEEQGVARVRVEVAPPPDEIEIAEKPVTPDRDRFAVKAAPVAAVRATHLPPPTGIAAAPPPEIPPSTDGAEATKPQPTELYVQAGAFSFLENAERLRERLAGLAEASVTPTRVEGRELFQVRIGPIANLEQADETLGRLIDNGHVDATIVVD